MSHLQYPLEYGHSGDQPLDPIIVRISSGRLFHQRKLQEYVRLRITSGYVGPVPHSKCFHGRSIGYMSIQTSSRGGSTHLLAADDLELEKYPDQ